MLKTSFLFPAAVLSLFVTVGCGDSDGGEGGAGGGTSTNGPATSGSTSSTGASTNSTGVMVPGCDDPTPKPGTPSNVDVTMVQASARDENEDGIGNTSFQLCGTDLCLTEDSSAIGLVTFSNSQATLERPLFKPGDSLTFGKIGYPYTEQSPSPLVGYFPRMTDSMTNMVPGQTVSAAGASLVVPAGYSIDELVYAEPAQQTFRAGTLPTDLVDDATGDAAFVMLYALGPVDTLLCPPAMLTVDNYADLPANSQVEFWGQEVSIEEFFGGYGEWIRLDDGVVSADGATITTANGIPALLTIAIRPL